MKGKILDFSVRDNQGVISGDDGNRYTFVGQEWKPNSLPNTGKRVDFEAEGQKALAVYLDQPRGNRLFSESPLEGFYRSSDDKMLTGVCAGLAHKWQVSRPGLRFATCLVSLFFGVPALIYILCWIVFPEQATKNP